MQIVGFVRRRFIKRRRGSTAISESTTLQTLLVSFHSFFSSFDCSYVLPPKSFTWHGFIPLIGDCKSSLTCNQFYLSRRMGKSAICIRRSAAQLIMVFVFATLVGFLMHRLICFIFWCRFCADCTFIG